ncbi:unnamed protein product [Periconia digitata]|uniref:Aldehyde dehydrogenase domain-containing protein n=1 Tax=Periconia digitata TaxID=1303443 RepID=A0A9W4XRF7_9PLEO|nr:unnamed protein product [Periconia digitata]
MPILENHPLSPELPIVPLHIFGSPYPPSPTTHLTPLTPALSTTPIHTYASATPSTATLACNASAKAFTIWKKTAPSYRRELLLKAVEVLQRRGDEISASQVKETCCAEAFAKINLKGGIEGVREIAAATAEIRGTVSQRGVVPGSEGREGEGLTIVVKEAIGVVLVIAPWNGAVILPLRALSQALAAGCTIVFKASELCPRTHTILVECFEEAGIPPGVINVVQARREDAAPVVEAIISHPAVRKVDFIGSAAVGSQIGQVCAKHLKPILMELGGKGPALVLDDADLEKAAKMCAMGAVANHGQLCFSTERIIIHEAVYDQFLALLSAVMQRLPGPAVGNAVSKQSVTHALDVLKDAETLGAKFIVGGTDCASDVSLKPTIVEGVTREMRIFDEETFGPSVSVYKAENDDEAVRMANDSKYGLNAAVHSKSWEHAYTIASQLEYGQVHINNMTLMDSPGQPIQGIKGSGWGQSNSIWGINEFLIEKTVMFHSSQGGFPFGP